MSHPPAYRISPHVSHQTIDGEVIAINFDDGVYHSLRGSAAAVWAGLESGASSAAMARAFAGPAGDVVPAIDAFVEKLREARLIEPGTAAPPAGEYSPAAGAIAWSVPELETFTDLSQLLLADPIHDVGAESWPTLEKSPQP